MTGEATLHTQTGVSTFVCDSENHPVLAINS